MKHTILITIVAATSFVAQADEKTVTEKVRDSAESVGEKTKEVARDTKDYVVDVARHAGRATREGWSKTKAYVSDEMPIYREGADEILAGLAKEIAEVKAQTPNAEPDYFRTRLLALDEQHAYLAKHLSLLSSEQIKDRSTGPRYRFDQCVSDLEEAIDQAKDGARTVSRNAAK